MADKSWVQQLGPGDLIMFGDSSVRAVYRVIQRDKQGYQDGWLVGRLDTPSETNTFFVWHSDLEARPHWSFVCKANALQRYVAQPHPQPEERQPEERQPEERQKSLFCALGHPKVIDIRPDRQTERWALQGVDLTFDFTIHRSSEGHQKLCMAAWLGLPVTIETFIKGD